MKASLLDRLRKDADAICARFSLRYSSIQAERANVKRRYGICYADGTIKIRLRHVTTGRPLKYSSLVSTLCHELAHLRHFDHSPRFHDFYQELLRWSRRQGIYQPTRKRPRVLTPHPVPEEGPLGAVGEPATAARSARPAAPHSPTAEPPGRAPEQLTLF